MTNTPTTKTMRYEEDSLGAVAIPCDALWGASTARALSFFSFQGQTMPCEIIHAFGLVKQLAAHANKSLKRLDPKHADAIIDAAKAVQSGALDAHFPLPIWQTGSGTATHMNVNEVIANQANLSLGQALGTKKPIHPNDHVNLGQSSNDTMGTVMHLAAIEAMKQKLFPALTTIEEALAAKADLFKDVIKVGRTHLQDAAPLTVGQELHTFVCTLQQAKVRLQQATSRLYTLAQGGTAVGTGLNTHPDFAKLFAQLLSDATGETFTPHPHPFVLLATHDDLVSLGCELSILAGSLFKMGSDLRLLASGPRCGFKEYILPANEPGSSIMPGKVNPTQIESLLMVCAKVKGLATALMHAGFDGQLQLHVMKPLIIGSLLEMISLLSCAMHNVTQHCIKGLTLNKKTIGTNLKQALMLVTALTPHIGYDKAALLAKHALAHDLPLKEAAIQLNLVSADDFEKWVNPAQMLAP